MYEDRYVYLFDTYYFRKEDFCTAFHEPPETFEYINDIQAQLDIINSDTATDAQKEAAVDELERLTSDEIKNANRATLDEYGPYDEALLRVNNLISDPVIIPSVKQDIVDRVAEIAATVIDENGDRFLKPGTAAEKQAVIDATNALNAIALELDANEDGKLDDSNKLPADYTEYDEVFAILETLKDNDKIKDELHNKIMDHINHPLPRDIKKDKQSVVDTETNAIKALLSEILDNNGNIKDSALIHYTVTFKWLNGQVSQKVVKGSSAVLPAGAPNTPGTIYGVDGKLDGHYIFRGWNQDYSNVTKDMFIDANYDVEAHTDADEDNKCEVCGCTIDTSFKCSMCPFYKKNKDIPVVGWFITLVHFFVHLAAQIGHWT